MTADHELDTSDHRQLTQLVDALCQTVQAAQELNAADLQQFALVLNLMHQQIALRLAQSDMLGPWPHAGAHPSADPIAVNARQAAKLLGIGHPLFYKQIMPHVYSGAILSFQVGHTRLILVESLRDWLEQAAHAAATSLPSIAKSR